MKSNQPINLSRNSEVRRLAASYPGNGARGGAPVRFGLGEVARAADVETRRVGSEFFGPSYYLVNARSRRRFLCFTFWDRTVFVTFHLKRASEICSDWILRGEVPTDLVS